MLADIPSPLQDGRFLLLEALGRGGMASVYRAFDRVEQRIVALKVAGDAGPAGPAHPLSAEFAAWSGLRHPNVVRAYELGVGRRGPLPVSRPYLVLEHVDGGPVNRMLRPGRLSPERLEDVAAQLLRGLEHVHGAGWVHRDLKPANVLATIGTDGIKLTDFGLACPVGRRGAPGVIDGSLPFVAPESLLGLPVDGRADLYGLGILLFWLATGELPSPTTSADALLRWHLGGPPVDPLRLRPRLRTRIAELIARLCARRADDRPRDAAEALTRLGIPRRRETAGALRKRACEERDRLRLALDAARLGARRVYRLPPCERSARTLVDEVRVWAQVRGVGHHRMDGDGCGGSRALARLALRLLVEEGQGAAAIVRRYRLDGSLPLTVLTDQPVPDERTPRDAARAARKLVNLLLDRRRGRPWVVHVSRGARAEPQVGAFVDLLVRRIAPRDRPASRVDGVLLLLAHLPPGGTVAPRHPRAGRRGPRRAEISRRRLATALGSAVPD